MSRENVEQLRDLVDRWNRGEKSDTSHFHPEVEWLPQRTATEGAYRGIAGIEKFLADTEQVFDTFELRFAEPLDLGDRVLVWGTIHVRTRHSGIETDIPVGGVLDFRDGKIARWQDYGSKERALEAVGLEE